LSFEALFVMVMYCPCCFPRILTVATAFLFLSPQHVFRLNCRVTPRNMYALFRRNFSIMGRRCSIYPNLLKRKEANPRAAR
jgi:hypothetical protein